MKFSKYVMCAGIAALMASCASDEPVSNPYAMPAGAGDADSYAVFSLALPEDGATRAEGDVEFAAGESTEYQIQNGKLLVFKKDNPSMADADATFVAEVDLTGAIYSESDKADLSREAQNVEVKFKKNTFEEGKSYYVAVVLNTSSNYSTPTVGMRLRAWNTSQTEDPFWYESNGNHYLTFTSASKYVKDSAGTTVLTAIDPSNLASTPDAVTTPMADLYVQRVMAKVSFNVKSKYTVGDDEAVVDGWSLDLTSVDANRIQITDGIATVLAKPFGHTEGGSFDRCYWAKSINYGTFTASNWQSKLNHEIVFENPATVKYHYVNENTNPYNMMKEAYNTRAVIRAKYTAAGIAAGKSFIVLEGSGIRWTIDDFEEAVYSKIVNLDTDTFVPAEDAQSAIQFKAPGSKGGLYNFNQCFENIVGADGKTLTETLGAEKAAAIVDAIATQIGIEGGAAAPAINYYKDGVCYYTVWVRHFNDSNSGIKWLTGDYVAAHEGRYGIVRNNWYDMTVNSISGLGEPSIKELDPDPDENIDKEDDGSTFIQVNLKMLNWAKRNQSVDL